MLQEKLFLLKLLIMKQINMFNESFSFTKLDALVQFTPAILAMSFLYITFVNRTIANAIYNGKH